jgi:hypothetical protein
VIATRSLRKGAVSALRERRAVDSTSKKMQLNPNNSLEIRFIISPAFQT